MRRLVVVLAVAAASLAVAPSAMAWKPFTHNYIGDQAYRDAIDDGRVTIGSHSYPLDPRLVAALKRSRPYYNAGVVGPDGFPDIAFGQSVIHPEHTGKWLSYLVDKAWAAQRKTGPGYATAEERGRILAFTYGYLTHAAGDMWGHTLINDFAGGVFPALGEFLAESKQRDVVLRHIVAEGYTGAATPGWDRSRGIKDRATVCRLPTPGTKCGDVSDDQTHGIQYAVPTQFIYDTLIDPDARLPVGTCGDNVDDDGDGVKDDGCPGGPYTVETKDPTRGAEPQRGAMLDSFLDLEAGLAIEAARRRFDAEDCTGKGSSCTKGTRELRVSTVRGVKVLRLPSSRCKAPVFCTPSTAVDEISPVARYLEEWVKDIDSGLKDWPKFSLAITKALFDPQARRDAQNDECEGHGSEQSSSRATCEEGVGATDTLIFETHDYFYDHLLSMLGAPDAGAGLAEIVGAAADALSDLIDKALGPALNRLRDLKVTVKSAVKELVNPKINDAIGMDPDQLEAYLTSPYQWMCNGTFATLTLPGIDPIPFKGLFAKGRHDQLDQIMGLPAGHHDGETNCSPLKAGSKYNFDPNKFAPIKNSITQAKLLLLDGKELNHASGDVLYDQRIIKSPDQAQTYPVGGNIMYTPLSGAPWLDLIDGDHAWRQDGSPRFPGSASGGTGQYPLWESCLLRPAFRALFTDWENGAANFPDLGDPPSPDLSARNPPNLTLRAPDLSIPLGGTTGVPAGSRFVAQASDQVFTDSAIKLGWRLYRTGTDPSSAPSQAVANGGTFTLPLTATGSWTLEVTAADGCGSRTRTQQLQIL